ncbi:MAG TPA: ABC transporter permease subunit, partial [Phycisphaerales bacterium]|nr:ABC transporter permease subunit [Phycisphaerales bacterium]
RSTSSAQFLVTARADGTVEFSRVRIVRPLGAGKPRATLTSLPVRFAAPAGVAATPDYLFALGDGANILALWNDGTLQRYALRVEGDNEEFILAETGRATAAGRTVATARLLLGSRTLLCADDAGGVAALFAAKTDTMKTFDGLQMVRAHTLAEPATGADGPRCTAMGIALRDRSVVMADSEGGLTVRHVTSEKLVAARRGVLGEPAALALVTPKGDGVVALGTKGAIAVMDLDAGHAEASVKSVFGKVWYEGDAGPSYTYQASTGEDTAETKYSNVPLIFGTLKSTLYAMLFAVPLAVAAALYTSEFLHARVKNRVKPVIEMMASLPSVVLGFLASIVIAPVFRDYLPGVLSAFFVIPVAVLGAAYLWQLVPIRVSARVGSLRHIGMVLTVVLISGAGAVWLGRIVERSLFAPSDADVLVLAGSTVDVPREQYPEALKDRRSIGAADVRPFRSQGLYYAAGRVVRPTGSVDDPGVRTAIEQNDLLRADMRLWLDGLIGTPREGWLIVMTPVGVLLAAGLRSRLVDARLERWGVPRIGTGAAATEIGKFLLTLATGVGIAGLLAAALTAAGLDARDSIFGGFSQRNTLVVGVAMGFAIIPIIYTISEDALSAVPGQLRSASLGCGATRWQTATRVVLPIALSGIFSAVMIGLGRAAGETMIVLMATGNTPNMDWNIFSGFRTLSANIATEMPEAAVGSTHYRVLFLGALCLFALTFIVNTVAEVVRQRVRRARAAL